MEKLKGEAERISRDSGIACEVLTAEGKVSDMIVQAVCEMDYGLVVIGTHGFKGLRQKLFGADILKLVSRVPIPVFVMQEGSPLVETVGKIVLPVGGHHNFGLAVSAAQFFGSIFNTEVHLYSIHKPGFDWSQQLITNIEDTVRKLEENGIKVIRVKEEQDGFSTGYARQTLRYAKKVNANIMLIMSVSSADEYNAEKVYKETVLLNEYNIPVMCAGGGSPGYASNI